ncbi:RNA polymerase sigma-70 factor (ECF subfamily) [Shimia isoporae]|uniref:RNA polymerase sigma-70 factor (ECF subfamily) n=1 Tax=Shimia isoporae TaxID=647720 RepID=A0A4V2Q217_9RHOB|nr:sigma-70 family RNA polymerase sigma factor [Shimia isoporae]TCL00534.1 RNA polymerase sigma-70 factor (ECF subfamily) [Shimia isoporae]
MKDMVDLFEAERPALLSMSYRMLGERHAAEDVVQEVWLRFSGARSVDNPRAWLRRVATNVAIDTLRSAQVRREHYVGPWLPEPLIGAADAGAEAGFELAEECELALLWAMERLAPAERAAFVLREAFDADYAEIAATLERTEAACRQMVSRAHKRLQSEGPRFDVSREEAAAALQKFFIAATQDHAAALKMLAADAMAVTDGGAKVRAARRVLRGPEEIMLVLTSVMAKDRDLPDVRFELVKANGLPAMARFVAGVLDTLTVVVPNAAGQVQWIYVMRNPEKLNMEPAEA